MVTPIFDILFGSVGPNHPEKIYVFLLNPNGIRRVQNLSLSMLNNSDKH